MTMLIERLDSATAWPLDAPQFIEGDRTVMTELGTSLNPLTIKYGLGVIASRGGSKGSYVQAEPIDAYIPKLGSYKDFPVETLAIRDAMLRSDRALFPDARRSAIKDVISMRLRFMKRSEALEAKSPNIILGEN